MKKVILISVGLFVALAYSHFAGAAIYDVSSMSMAFMAIGATNYVQEGDILTLTAPYDRTSGQGAQIGSQFAIALKDVLNGASGEWATCGVWDLTALSTATGAMGAKAYWDNTNKRVDTDGTVGILIGVLVTAKTNGQTTARVKLNEAVVGMSEGPQPAIGALTDSTGGSGTHDDTLADGLTAAALTEAAGAIGGTNDGDLPDLTATAAALTENAGPIGGTNDGDLPALVDPAGDAGASLIAGVRESAAAINKLVADNIALRASVRELATMLNTVVTDLATQNQNDSDLVQKVLEIRTAMIAAGVIAAA